MLKLNNQCWFGGINKYRDNDKGNGSDTDTEEASKLTWEA
jgi:hypothetical protein